MANAIQLFKILYKTQHKPVHEVRLRSQENEANDKGGGGGGTLSGAGYSLRYVQLLQGMADVFSVLGFWGIAIEFRKFCSLIGNGLL